jgi:hypothetical protein
VVERDPPAAEGYLRCCGEQPSDQLRQVPIVGGPRQSHSFRTRIGADVERLVLTRAVEPHIQDRLVLQRHQTIAF